MIQILVFLIASVCAQNLNLSTVHTYLKKQTQKVVVNQSTLIDYFPFYGATLSSVLLYENSGFEDHPCKLVKSKISFSKKKSFPLIREYTPANFEAFYENGEFSSSFPQLIAMVHIDNGVAVISNIGDIVIIKVKNEEINISFVGKVSIDEGELKLFYSKKHIFIVQKQISSFSLDVINEIQINFYQGLEFKQKNITQYLKIHDQDIQNIQNIAVSSKFIYFAQGELGMHIIKHQGDELILGDIFRDPVNCVRVVSSGQLSQSEMVYILNNNGVHIFEYELQKFTHLLTVNISNCFTFDIFRNTLILLRKSKDGDYFADDIHLNIDQKDWTILNTWAFENAIHEVQVTEDFAIFLGINGHHAIQHSIYRNFYPKNGTGHLSNQIAIHGLLNLDFFAKYLKSQEEQNEHQHEDQILFGMTTHQVVFYEWFEEPLKIICLSDNLNHIKTSPLKLQLSFNTTQCPQKQNKEDDLVMCTQVKEYEVTFVHWFVSSKHRYFLYLVEIVVGGLFFGIILALVIKFYLYLKEKSLLSQQVSELQKQGFKLPEQPVEPISEPGSAKSCQYQLEQDSNRSPNLENKK